MSDVSERHVHASFAEIGQSAGQTLVGGGSVGPQWLAQRATTSGERPCRPLVPQPLCVHPDRGAHTLLAQPLQDGQHRVLDAAALIDLRPPSSTHCHKPNLTIDQASAKPHHWSIVSPDASAHAVAVPRVCASTGRWPSRATGRTSRLRYFRATRLSGRFVLLRSAAGSIAAADSPARRPRLLARTPTSPPSVPMTTSRRGAAIRRSGPCQASGALRGACRMSFGRRTDHGDRFVQVYVSQAACLARLVLGVSSAHAKVTSAWESGSRAAVSHPAAWDRGQGCCGTRRSRGRMRSARYRKRSGAGGLGRSWTRRTRWPRRTARR